VDVSDWGERNNFLEPFSVRRHQVPLVEGFTYRSVAVSAHPEGLRVLYHYDGGAPNRWFLNRLPARDGAPGGQIMLVRPGEWARVCYNGRFSCSDTGNWWYEQVTVNVAWFADECAGRVFLDSEAAHELRSLADLR
jgi:hypothetical protein